MAANFLTDLGILAADETPNTGHLVCVSISDSLTAAGSTAAGALALTSNVNNVTTTASGTGVRLPAQAAPGARIVVLNNGASALLPYPPTGGFLNGGTDRDLAQGLHQIANPDREKIQVLVAARRHLVMTKLTIGGGDDLF